MLDRRNFLKLSGALGTAAFAPSLFAKEEFKMWGAPALPSVIMAVASLQGELSKTYNMSLEIWRTPDQLRAGVANGDMKITMSPSNVAANLRNQGLNYAMLNILTQGIMGAMVKDERIKNIEDLANKKIIMPFKNDMPDLILRALWKKRGLDFNTLNVTYTQTPPEAVGLFLQKDFDVIIVPQPLCEAVIMRGKKMGVSVQYSFDFSQMWGESFKTKPYIPQAGIIVKVDYYNANKQIFEILHSDLQNALKWILQNKLSAAKIGGEYLPAPEPALVGSFEKANLTVTKASDIKDEIMAFFAEIFEFNPKLLGGKMPDQSLFL